MIKLNDNETDCIQSTSLIISEIYPVVVVAKHAQHFADSTIEHTKLNHKFQFLPKLPIDKRQRRNAPSISLVVAIGVSITMLLLCVYDESSIE